MATLDSNGKINLFLEVTGKRADGFHAIDSVFAEIDFRDTLQAVATENGALALGSDDPDLPLDERNLVMRAAASLRHESSVRSGARLFLRKRIPQGSGLGGGSANAAAAFRLLDGLWDCRFSKTRLAALGARLGSDVPFFFEGGLCRCQGRGEIITPIQNPPAPLRLGLVLTGIHSDTATAYRGLNLPDRNEVHPADAFLAALARDDVPAMEAAAFNRFEATVFQAIPRLGILQAELQNFIRRPVRMSGSGSSLWFFRRDDGEREIVQKWCGRNGCRYVPVLTVAAQR